MCPEREREEREKESERVDIAHFFKSLIELAMTPSPLGRKLGKDG